MKGTQNVVHYARFQEFYPIWQ